MALDFQHGVATAVRILPEAMNRRGALRAWRTGLRQMVPDTESLSRERGRGGVRVWGERLPRQGTRREEGSFRHTVMYECVVCVVVHSRTFVY